MRTVVIKAICVIALSLPITVPAHSQNQQNNKNAPPPRAAPARPMVRPQMVRPTQQVRPGQVMQGQRPGQMMQGQRLGIVGQVRFARPGVVRGPAGALRPAMPAKLAHNPRHVAGRAASRYNRQAFMFRRGNHFYRRAYYVGPGGGIFFYDDPIPDGDPAPGAMAPDNLPTCPVDADDCQGFNDPAAGPSQMDPRYAALQYLLSITPGIPWQENGLIFSSDDADDVLVPYNKLEVTVNHYLPFGAGPEQLYVGTTGLLGGSGFRLYSGSYQQSKAEWDRAIVAIRNLGVQAATPSGADTDIRSIR